MTDFMNQVAVVTGASSGIGKAIALDLADKGAALCLVGRDSDKLNTLSASRQLGSTPVQHYRVDLSLDDDIQKLRKCIENDFGHLDILIYCAGAISFGPVESS